MFLLVRGLSVPGPGRLWLVCVAECCRRWGSAWQQRTRGSYFFAQGVCRRPWSHGGVSYRCGGGSRSGGGSARVRLHVAIRRLGGFCRSREHCVCMWAMSGRRSARSLNHVSGGRGQFAAAASVVMCGFARGWKRLVFCFEKGWVVVCVHVGV